MKERKIICVDLDDVIIDFNAAACDWHNETYGTCYSKDDIRSYDLGSVWQCSEEEKLIRVFEFYASEAHLRAPPVRGAIETLAKLWDQGHAFAGASSRPEAILDVTLALLRRYGVLRWFVRNELLGHYHGPEHNRNLTKADICREVGAIAFIDDMMSHTSLVAAELGIPTFLFNAPWNQGEVPEGVIRVNGWEEVPPMLSR